MTNKKKLRVSKRDIIELSMILFLFLVVYLTGSQAEVFGRVQELILKTGIMNASVSEDETKEANLDFILKDIEGNQLNVNIIGRKDNVH